MDKQKALTDADKAMIKQQILHSFSKVGFEGLTPWHVKFLIALFEYVNQRQ